MFPGPIKIGPIPIQPYGLMIAVAFLLVLFLVERDARKRGLPSKTFQDMAFWVLVVGIIGTRILHIIMFPKAYAWNDPIGWIALWRGGLVYQGAPPIAILFGYWYLRRKGVPVWKGADSIFPYVPIGHAVGRIGCFLRGCCYGARTNLPWGVRFPPGSPAHADHFPGLDPAHADQWSDPVHPTQLYAVLSLTAIAAVLLLLRKKWRPFDGFTMPVYLCLYGGYRFFIEFIRDDHNPTHLGSFSDQQVISILFIIAGAFYFFYLRRKNRPETP